MDKVNLQVIRESFGRVAYSHKTHEKAAELEEGKAKTVKWANVILTTLTSGALITTIVTSQPASLYISAVLSTVALGFMVFQLSFSPAENSEKHRCLAKDLWYARERYVNLLADISNGQLSQESIITRRNQLTEELRLLYKFAPQTDSRSYEQARTALKFKEELTFSDEEVDQFLPNGLKVKPQAQMDKKGDD